MAALIYINQEVLVTSAAPDERAMRFGLRLSKRKAVFAGSIMEHGKAKRQVSPMAILPMQEMNTT